MKKSFALLILLCIGMTSFASPNEKVLVNFNLSFPKADSVKWYDNANDYEVHFVMSNMRCRMWYDKEGMVIKSLRYYGEELLPPMVRSSIQQRWTKQKVYGVTELSDQEGVRYYIVLEDEKKWYDVTSDGLGNLTLTKKFNKA